MRKNLRVLALCLVGGVLASLGFHVTGVVADEFSDVPSGNFFKEEIDWLTDYDIANGFPDGTFDPEANIKRQQAALWFSNYNDSIHLVSETANPTSANAFSINVDCAPDERAIAGGGSTDLTGLLITDTYPNNTSDWFVRWQQISGGTVDPSQVRGWALCAPLPVATNGA